MNSDIMTVDALEDWRQRIIRGETPSSEDMRRIVEALQPARNKVLAAGPKQHAKVKGTRQKAIDLSHLLGGGA